MVWAMRRVGRLFLLALTLLVLAPPAWAHRIAPASPDRAAMVPEASGSEPQRPELPASGASPDVPRSAAAPWALLIAAGVAVIVVRSRRAVAGLVVVLLAVFLFDAAIHSVHHLGDRDGAARCVVESAASHLSGVVLAMDSIAPPAATCRAEFCREAFPLAGRPFRSERDRAPPLVA
jgi:hypothetical protein